MQELEGRSPQHHAAESKLNAQVAQLATTLDQERKQAEEKLAAVKDAERKLSDAFKALASEALKSNNQSFYWQRLARRANDLTSNRSRSRWKRWTRRSASWKRPGPGPTAA